MGTVPHRSCSAWNANNLSLTIQNCISQCLKGHETEKAYAFLSYILRFVLFLCMENRAENIFSLAVN